jgi:hypothetical protein
LARLNELVRAGGVESMAASRQLGELTSWSDHDSLIETRHAVYVITVVDGKLAGVVGSPDLLNPLRPTGKAFLLSVFHKQFSASVEDEEIALFASSNNGKPYHRQALKGSLIRRGISKSMFGLDPQSPIVPDLNYGLSGRVLSAASAAIALLLRSGCKEYIRSCLAYQGVSGGNENLRREKLVW